MKRKNPFSLFAFVICALLSLVAAFASGAPPGEYKITSDLTIRTAFDPQTNRLELLAIKRDPFALPTARPKQEEPPPASSWSGAWVYRLSGDKEDRASAGVLTKITPLTGVAGKFTLSLDGYAGVSLRKSVPVFAVLVGGEFRLADQLRAGLHAGFLTAQGQPTGVCVATSINLKFAGL